MDKPSTREDKIKAYTGGTFALELDQKHPVGWITAIDGAHFKASTVTSMVGADGYVTKYAGKPTYEDFTITCGMAMSPKFWDWVQASLDGKPQRRHGALVGYDFNFVERTRRSFFSALIAEVQFPALDASSKSATSLNVKISPERLQYDKASGSSQPYAPSPEKQKLWGPNQFSFSLDRFKGDESLLSCKVEAFTVKQNIIQNPIGFELETRKEIGRLELPNMVVTFPESLAAGWFDWFNTAVVRGDRQKQQTTGVITYYAQNKKELMRVELEGVTLLSLELDKFEGQKEGIAQVKATLHIEGLKLKPGQGNA
jgi:hypothetical protein